MNEERKTHGFFEVDADDVVENAPPKTKGRPRGTRYQNLNTIPLWKVKMPKTPQNAKTHIYFVGVKQETTRWCHDYFAGNIVIKTPNHPRNGVICFKDYYGFDIKEDDPKCYPKIAEFYKRAMTDVLEADPKAEFMMYDARWIVENKIYNLPVICHSHLGMLDVYANKYKAHQFLLPDITNVHFLALYKHEITPKWLDKVFEEHFDRWVVQDEFGTEGSGTIFIDRKNYTRARLRIKEGRPYMVSGFVEDNIPVNVQFMINPFDTLIFDGNVQKFVYNVRMLYDGWDFDAFEKLPEQIKEKVYEQTRRVMRRLQEDHYQGIGGVDFIVDKNENVFFMEINGGFEPSSEELDKRLQAKGFPSLFEMNYMCFYEQDVFKKLAKKLSH